MREVSAYVQQQVSGVGGIYADLSAVASCGKGRVCFYAAVRRIQCRYQRLSCACRPDRQVAQWAVWNDCYIYGVDDGSRIRERNIARASRRIEGLAGASGDGAARKPGIHGTAW